MRALIAAADAIDRLSRFFGMLAAAAVLAACLISAATAMARYGLGVGSNAWLEIQWYLFGAMILLGGALTLQRNEHVRVDLVYMTVGARARLWLDTFGLVVFLLPGMALMAVLSWPGFWEAWVNHEVSDSPGGLLRWPAKLLLPVGFALVTLQGLADLVRRVAALQGVVAVDTTYVRPEQ